MYVAKVAAFQAFGALPAEVPLQRIGLAFTLIAGSFVGRVVVLTLSEATFRAPRGGPDGIQAAPLPR
ncbi:MAG: hypothetical protein H7147_06300 [Frankiaceae bacterium]|nr:hypothetical protein [Arenimonas sp.]